MVGNVPRGTPVKEQRNERVLRRYREGLRPVEIAMLEKISRQRVHQLLKRANWGSPV